MRVADSESRPQKLKGFWNPAELFTPNAFDFRPHHVALSGRGH